MAASSSLRHILIVTPVVFAMLREGELPQAPYRRFTRIPVLRARASNRAGACRA